MTHKLNKLFLVVPKIIEQPTWGGNFILEHKNWSKKKPFSGLRIGQSYELFSGTKVRSDLNSSEEDSFSGELGYAMQPDKVIYQEDQSKLISLKDLIGKDPDSILGKKVVEKHGPEMKILIKFTQAKGNSFQLHVKDKDSSDRWLAKPESWYYFKPGLITLGLKKDCDLKKYRRVCLEIEKKMNSLATNISSKKITIEKARKRALEFITKENPWQFVNLVKVETGELVDLSCCGLHHSWEEDSKNFPNGNVVYELCLDVMDPISSIRSFDKGKIKSDGSLREIHVEDYFQNIDTSERTNDPKNHQRTGEKLFSNASLLAQSLMRSKWYNLDVLSLKGKYSGTQTNTSKTSFHHLFCKNGSLTIETPHSNLKLTRGHSCFIPACAERYSIESEDHCEILKTFVA